MDIKFHLGIAIILVAMALVFHLIQKFMIYLDAPEFMRGTTFSCFIFLIILIALGALNGV